MVCILRPPSRDQGNRTRERQQKTLVGLCESFLTAAPGLKAHLEAEPSARPVPLPSHRRLPPRLVLPAQVEMMASTLPHSLVRLAVAALHTKQSARNPRRLEQHCPPRDQELSRQGHDQGLARVTTGVGRPRPVPLRQRTLLLMKQEAPGQLDHPAPHAGVARLGGPFLAPPAATLVG